MGRRREAGARVTGLIAVLVVSTALSGCVLVVGPESDGRSDWVHDRDHADMDHGSSHRSYASTSDRGIRDAIRESMAADPLLQDQRITVAVDRGDVTLHGRVTDLAQFDRAVEIATAADGVGSVVSRLVVEVR